MITPPMDRGELLDDVLADDRGGNAAAAGVIAAIRREKEAKARRRRAATAATAATAAALAATLALIHGIDGTGAPTGRQISSNPSAAPAETPKENEPKEIEIERIGDEELLELLGDQPAALAQLPDGGRQLMLVVDRHSSTYGF